MYQVWIKNEFNDEWVLTECPDKAAVKEAVLAATKLGQAVKVSVPVEFSVDVTIREPAAEKTLSSKEKYRKGVSEPIKEDKDEVTPGGPEGDSGTGAESHGPV